MHLECGFSTKFQWFRPFKITDLSLLLVKEPLEDTPIMMFVSTARVSTYDQGTCRPYWRIARGSDWDRSSDRDGQSHTQPGRSRDKLNDEKSKY